MKNAQMLKSQVKRIDIFFILIIHYDCVPPKQELNQALEQVDKWILCHDYAPSHIALSV